MALAFLSDLWLRSVRFSSVCDHGTPPIKSLGSSTSVLRIGCAANDVDINALASVIEDIQGHRQRFALAVMRSPNSAGMVRSALPREETSEARRSAAVVRDQLARPVSAPTPPAPLRPRAQANVASIREKVLPHLSQHQKHDDKRQRRKVATLAHDALPRAAIGDATDLPSAGESVVRGYKVKVKRQNRSAEDVARRRGAVASAIARAIKR